MKNHPPILLPTSVFSRARAATWRHFFLGCCLALAALPGAVYGANADLSIPVHSHDPAQLQINDSINYYFTVRNNSTTNTGDNVTVTVAITGGQQYIGSASPYPFHDNGDGTFTATIGTIGASEDKAFRISFQITASGAISATATVSSTGDPNSGNNSATESATVTQMISADVRVVSVTAAPNPAKVGDLKQYHGVVTNVGPSAATNVKIGIQADSQNSSGLGFDNYETFVSAAPSPSPAGADANGFRYLPLGNIPVNGTVEFDVFYREAQQGFVSRNFFLTLQDADPNTSNNHLTAFSSIDETGSPGQLSPTIFMVNGTTNPTANAANTVLRFAANQSKLTAGNLGVRVQWTTSAPPHDGNVWTNLPDGNNGRMTLESTAAPQVFVLNSLNYPAQNGVYFRAVSGASGYEDSASNAVGPFNLASATPHLGPTVFTMQGSRAPFSVIAANSIAFAATESTVPAGISLRVQSSTTPETEASWHDLADGHSGVLQQSGSDPTSFTLQSNNYPTGSGVYFRIIATAPSQVDSISNLIGPFTLVADTPPVVTVTPPGGVTGSGSGADEDHAIYVPTGTFTISAHATSGRQITGLSILYDGDVIDHFNGQMGTVQYTTNVPGDHILSAVAQDDLGTAGDSAPVYLRILPRSGRIFFLTTSGDWNTPGNWLDTHGQSGVPGPNDLAIVGASAATLSQDTEAFAVVVNGGSISGAHSLSVTGYLVMSAGELRDMELVIQPTATCHLINDVDVAMNGIITNYGKFKLSGSGTIGGVSTALGARSGTDQPTFNLFAAVRNFGSWLFQRKTTPARTNPAPRVVQTRNVANNGTMASNTHAGLISQDGNGLIGQDGNGLIGQDGNGFHVHHGGSSRPTVQTPADAASADYVQMAGETNLNGITITGSVGVVGGVLSGSGIINGDLTNSGGFITPGNSPGAMIVNGNFTQEAGGTLILEAAGPDVLQYDHLLALGTATLGGTLHVKLIDGYQPNSFASFNPLGYDAVSGSFANVSSNAQLTLNPTGALAIVDPSAAQPQPGQPANISTRMRVLTGDKVLIGGFIVKGAAGTTKAVLIRGKGPSLTNAGLSGLLADPLLELHLPGGATVTNDNWGTAPNKDRIPNGFAPTSPKESIIIADLAPGNYTVIERGADGGSGIGLTEIYDIDGNKEVKLANISTRGFVDTGDNVLIGGFIVSGTEPAGILVRARGPSLTGLSGVLADPMLELHDGNGNVFTNDDWRETQESEIAATTIPPTNNKEAAILATLVPGNYTAIVRGKDNTTGIGLVEVYKVK